MNFASDPILGGQQSTPTIDSQMAEWAQKFAELQKQKNTFTMQPQQSKTPIWDEIDKIMDGLTNSQKSFLNQNKDFVESYQDVANILQREELKLIRPLVESTKDGKEALERHLALIRKLKKNALQEEDKNMALWKDYIANHSDKTWQEYLNYIKNQKGEQK